MEVSKRPTSGDRSRRIRFVNSDSAGLPVKRKQVQKACETCRVKKKQCRHLQAADAGIATLESESPSRPENIVENGTVAQKTSSRIRPRRGVANELDVSSTDAYIGNLPGAATPTERDPYFVSDLNPEGVLIEAVLSNEATSTSSSQRASRSEIGVWRVPSDKSKQPTFVGAVPAATETQRLTSEHRSIRGEIKQQRDEQVRRCLTSICFPDATSQVLRDIYWRKIHPIFPILADHQVRGSVFASLSNLEPVPQKQADRVDCAVELACMLAASSDIEARDHLRLGISSEPMSHSEFASEIISILKLLLQEVDFYNRTFDHIRVLALTAFFWQPEEREKAGPAKLFAEAVAIVHSVGLHLEEYDLARRAPKHRGGEVGPGVRKAETERLFLCMYVLDRIMAALHGKPLLFHPRDFDRDVPKCAERQSPCFCLVIYVVLALDKVIGLYRPRPSQDMSLEDDSCEVPVFEALVLDAGAQNVPQSLLATLEVFHHAVSALSIRQPRPLMGKAIASSNDRNPAAIQQRIHLGYDANYPHLPEPRLNARRSLSADRIVQIVKDYNVSAMPFIPYALSISLSIAYQKWRLSQIPMFRARGRAFFEEIVPILEHWGKVFKSAQVNSELAKKVIEGMGAAALVARESHAPSQSTNDNRTPSQRLRNGADKTQTNGELISQSYQPPIPQRHSLSTPVLPDTTPDDLTSFDLFPYLDNNFDLGGVDLFFDQNLEPLQPILWQGQTELDISEWNLS